MRVRMIVSLSALATSQIAPCLLPCHTAWIGLQHTCNPELHGQRIKQKGGFFLSCWTISSEPLIKLWIPSTHEKLPGMLLLYLITLLMNFICCQMLHNSQLFFPFFFFLNGQFLKNMQLLFIWILQRQKCRVKVKVKQLHLPVIKKGNETSLCTGLLKEITLFKPYFY